MSLATEMMGGGLSSGQAQAINGGVNPTVSAAGTTLATATEVTAGVNLVTTVAASSGVRLPNSEIGDEIMIYNSQVTNTLKVYPPTSSGTINQLSAGTAMTLAQFTAVRLKKLTATTWIGWLSA